MLKEFETERLIIRPTLEEDAKLIYELMNSPKFIKYVGDREINSIDDAKKHIQTKLLSQLSELGYSSYSLVKKADEEKVGICGLYSREGVDGIDIGFGLLPQYEGFGYALEASQRILKAAFEEFEIRKIKAITSKNNLASQRLLEKLGLELKGETKLPNEDNEILLYEKSV